MSGVKGDFSKLSRLAASLQSGGVVAAQRTAARVAPAITEQARATFASGKNAYGDAWAPSKTTGKPVTLRKSGALFGTVRFVSVGTRVRCVLGVRYAKYQIGKRGILPSGGAALPPAWSAKIRDIATRELREQIGGA